ncbi:MAG: hypothetical protein IJJ33_16960 [Victivallales bacterium]|nr:hypothetical protein [Victivallales bacterium]
MLKRIALLILLLPLLLTAQVRVINGGIGGHNTQRGVKRINTLLIQYKPTILVIGYGANDAINSEALVSETDFRKNLAEMIALARKNQVQTIVLNSCNPCLDSYLVARHKYDDGVQPSERIRKYNQIIAETAAEQKVIFNDFHAAVMQNGGASDARTSLVRNIANSKSKDGLHLTAEGAKLLAETVTKSLDGKVKDNDRILCLGDSITYGASLSGAGTATGQTYPAWLMTMLNFKLGLSQEKSPQPYIPPRPMQIPNGSFENDKAECAPLEWVMAEGTGSIFVVADGGHQFLRITPQGIAFCRTSNIPGAEGKWLLRLRARGKGGFQLMCSMRNAEYVTVPLHKDWLPLENSWQSFELPLDVPSKVRFCNVIIRAQGEVADFDDVTVVPASAEKMPAAAKLKTVLAEIHFLHPCQGGGMDSIIKDNKTEFINYDVRKSIWSITLKKIDISNLKLPEAAPLSVDPERDDNGGGKNTDDSTTDLIINALDSANAQTELKADDKTVAMRWQNLNIGGEKGVLDVQVEIKISEDGKSFVFSGGFANRSKKYTVFYFDYPALGGLGGLNGQADKDFLATPFFNGRLIRNPVEKGLFQKNRIYQPNRSGHSMHMDAFYNSGQGLYLGVHDPEQYAKRWDISSDQKNGVSWTVRNIPDNMRQVPQQWRIPYPILIQVFNGDWYDGCQIYRDWATAQTWCKEGKTNVRQNLPQWFKDIAEWGQYPGTRHDTEEPMMRRFRKDFPQYPLGVFLSYWGSHTTLFHDGDPDRFPLTERDRQILKSLKENEVSIMGYIQCISWADYSPSFQKDPELAKKNLVRNYYGQYIKWPYKRTEQDIIAYPGEVWAKALGDNIVKMAEAGFRAAYLDSGNHGGTYLNFTPACSSDSGGGTGYVKGQWQLLETIRARARKVNPEFCFTAESFWEGNIAYLDGYLVCNTTNAYLEGDRVTAIPMAQTVYGDYSMMHGLWPSRYDTERDNALGYVAKNALALCWGVTPGWNIFNLLYTYGNKEIAQATSRERYAAYAAGKKYFVYGQLLRPPKIISHVKPLRVKWHRSYSAAYYDILMDAVIGTVFQAPDGSYALVLYNISEQAQKVKADLQKSLPLGGYTYQTLYPAQQKFNQGNELSIELEVPARIPVIITLEQK